MVSSPADQIPLIIQDRTFVPGAAQLAAADPTWDSTRWGGEGNLWYHHVYMPAQNPGDPGGMSAYGRWMYGPGSGLLPRTRYMDRSPTRIMIQTVIWRSGHLAVPDRPILRTAENSGYAEHLGRHGAVQRHTLVNGTAYPTTTVQPKSYRMRILNAANDRFWNLQWYMADPTHRNRQRSGFEPG